MNIQALFDGMSAQWAAERAATQMTLGKMIEALKAMPADTQVAGISDAHSYRGYYRDLAFEPSSGTQSAATLLAACEGCMGQVFQGYKGGDFPMHAMTPLWVANYGCCGQKIMGFNPDGSLVLQDDE